MAADNFKNGSTTAKATLLACIFLSVLLTGIYYACNLDTVPKDSKLVINTSDTIPASPDNSSIINVEIYAEEEQPEASTGGLGNGPEHLSDLPDFSKPQALYYFAYRVRQGDMIGTLAESYGLNQDTLLSFNDIRNSRLLQIGQYLKIPNQDGILYTVERGDTLTGIAERYEVDDAAIQEVNNIAQEEIKQGVSLFIPGGRLSQIDVQEINGDLFKWPVRGYISSPYGYRASPFTGVRQFHSGIDIATNQGTPVRAAMAGRVSAVGYDTTWGNYIAITHHSGYRTFYAHLSVVRVRNGNYVRANDRIGDIGSTGLSTGPHLHFTVFKNGVTVNPRLLMN